jgi:hypothetical protein
MDTNGHEKLTPDTLQKVTKVTADMAFVYFVSSCENFSVRIRIFAASGD